MSQKFKRKERRWLLTEGQARFLEWHLLNEGYVADEYGVESTYLRITKRSRIRLRRYSLAGSQEEKKRSRDEATQADPASVFAGVAASFPRIRFVPASSVRDAEVATYPRSAGPFSELDTDSLLRRATARRSRRRGQGEPAEVASRGAGTTEQEIQQEPMVHGR
jgi:hypothetical protein